MDASISRLLESHFGPESELIDVEEVSWTVPEDKTASAHQLAQRWASISEDRKIVLASECSIQDLKATLQETWADPTMSSYLLKDHDRIAATISIGFNKDGKATRRGQISAPDTLHLEIRALHSSINSIKLSSWTYPTEAVAFVRTPRNSDQNAYDKLKSHETSRTKAIVNEQEAIMIVTIFNKTLGDLCKAIPCAPYAACVSSSSNDSAYNYVVEEDSGCVVCIEGTAYGDGREGDYAAKLVDHLATVSKSKPPLEKATGSLDATILSSLSIRVNEPYWLLHRGNCEHFVVIEQIRTVHPSDPRAGYPIMLHHAPQLLDICRACAKSPAVWSIVNDIRLGESPSFLCAPCWANMGLPDSSESGPVEIIPLLSHVP
ncbi:snRNA-activating protein complex subunit 3 [Leucoagaricus sp. SymC.cos]|nr:snRNA-activating protein complex subunit 3 [Leucoagaricus sp. SymC.cos]